MKTRLPIRLQTDIFAPPPYDGFVPEPLATRAPDPAPRGEYRVRLDAYAGPLDLLLYLVKRHEIDLHDIPMATLTGQYLEHLRVIEQLPGQFDVDTAGEFLVMAATLVEVKSQMLMPRLRDGGGGDDAAEGEGAKDAAEGLDLDPRFELVQQLLAYKRYKDASLALGARQAEWDARYPAEASAPRRDPATTQAGGEAEAGGFGDAAKPFELDLEDVNIMDLCAAFGRMLDSIGFTGDHEVTYDDTPISLHAEDIADRLARDGGGEAGPGLTLGELFVGRSSRSELIGLFLATLELVRQRRVKVMQDEAAPGESGGIRLYLRPEADRETPTDESPADWTDPGTGEVVYDWPSERDRRRAERRAQLRATYAEKREAGEEVDDADNDHDDL